MKGGSGRNEIALRKVQRQYPDMTMEEFLRIKQDALLTIRLAMVNKGHTEFGTMDEEVLRLFIQQAIDAGAIDPSEEDSGG